jgi:hypothetical protein
MIQIDAVEIRYFRSIYRVRLGKLPDAAFADFQGLFDKVEHVLTGLETRRSA